MAAAQNERLKTLKSPVESLTRGKSSGSQLFNQKTGNDLKNEDNLNNSGNDLLSKHLELRKIPLSTSSSSSSSLDSFVVDRKMNKKTNGQTKAEQSQENFKNTSMIQKNEEFIQSEDDFPVSIKSDNTSTSN